MRRPSSATDLPSNGRSNGSLTVTTEGRLLYDTSGRQEGTRAADGSGVLWSLDPQAPASGDQPVLTGMKHAYATAEDGRGGLLVTEIGDGTYDGERPPDEVVLIGGPGGPESAGDDVPDGGWPRCVGDRVPVEENEGTAEWCERAVPSLALFEPGATPTSVAVAPWDAETAVVALWQAGEVVQLPIVRGAGDPPVQSHADPDGPGRTPAPAGRRRPTPPQRARSGCGGCRHARLSPAVTPSGRSGARAPRSPRRWPRRPATTGRRRARARRPASSARHARAA